MEYLREVKVEAQLASKNVSQHELMDEVFTLNPILLAIPYIVA